MSPTDGHTIIEVATVAIIDGVIVDGEKWSSLIRPGRPIPAEASAVHGITDAMVEEAPAPETVAVELRRRCCDETLVFHNYPFDLPFLSALLRAGGAAPFYNPVVDTLGLARGLLGPGGNSLGALAARLGLPREPQHRALGDALTTARLFLALAAQWEEKGEVRTLAELAALSQDTIRQTASR